jgi:hypothetical protein
MTAAWISVGTSVAAFAASVSVSLYARGVREGIVKSDIAYMKRDIENIMRYFRLVPAEEQDKRRR